MVKIIKTKYEEIVNVSAIGDTQNPIKLNELLELVKEFINNHTHAYPGLPPVKTKLEEDILNYNLNDLISNNIRIN